MPAKAIHTPFADGAADRIDALGEAALLCRIRQWLGNASPPSPQGIGDDCAVWPAPPQSAQLLFTTDAVVYGRHFDATCPPELAAAKLLKRNLSDIAAMGGIPHSALLALTLPRNLSLRWLEKFYLGLRDCSLRYATPVTGGDITEGTDDFFAAHITLIGHATRPLLRSGAQAGDHLFVTGALGGSIHGHHLHFEPRLAQGQWLASQPDVRALIDITDGLAKDLPELLGSASASPRVVARQAHAQAKRQRTPLAGGGTESTGAEAGGTGMETGSVETTSGVRAENPEAEGKPEVQTVPTTATPAVPTTVAMLNLAVLPLSDSIRHAVSKTITGLASHATGERVTNAHDTPLHAASPKAEELPQSIAHALFDGEDYELLFAVDHQTDPAEFIARWQTHFGQSEPLSAAKPVPHQSPNADAAPTTAATPDADATSATAATPDGPQAAWPTCIGQIALLVNHPANAPRLYDAATGQPLPFSKNGFEHLKS